MSEALSQELIDKAVRIALDHNTKSSIQFLLRERLIREVIEVATPILMEPLLDRIESLEKELAASRGEAVKKPSSEKKLTNLKDALDGVMDAIKVENPLL